MIGAGIEVKGGVSSVVKEYYRAGLDKRCELTYIGTACDGSKAKKLLRAMKAYIDFSRVVDDFDIVHVHMASRASYERKKRFVRVALRHGKKVILHLHGGEFDLYFLNECSEAKRREIRGLFSSVAKVVVLSEYWFDFFSANVCDRSKLVVMYNSVEVSSSYKEAQFLPNVLFLGRLGRRKSPDVILRAAQMVLTEFPDAGFYLAGDGEIAEYQRLASELGISNSCHFLGWVNDEGKEELFRKCSVYCLPSRNEAMPMSVLEAMAHGLATISTPVGGIPQIIKDGENGFLMPIGDSEHLAATISRLFKDRALFAQISREGYRTILEDFNSATNVDGVMRVYQSVLGHL